MAKRKSVLEAEPHIHDETPHPEATRQMGMSYLAKAFNLADADAAAQLASESSDTGVDGFHHDAQKKNLYLFIFNTSIYPDRFTKPMVRLVNHGLYELFDQERSSEEITEFAARLRSCMTENESLIDRVCLHFVFPGDPATVERSRAIDFAREQLQARKHLLDSYFQRPIPLVIEFRSLDPGKASLPTTTRKASTWTVEAATGVLQHESGHGEYLTVALVRLADLVSIYRKLGNGLFERNVRYALPEGRPVGLSIEDSLREIVSAKDADPETFLFNHNGVSIYSEKCELRDGRFHITEPRLLNGVQTVISAERFLAKFEGGLNPEQQARFNRISLLCKIIQNASTDFIASVTVSNNRQNPVNAWQLRANDLVQLEIEDRLREQFGIYYERQQGSFQSLSPEDLNRLGITEKRPMQMTRLAKTLLAVRGELDQSKHLHGVFENHAVYHQVFGTGLLECDARRLILCYKLAHRLKRFSATLQFPGNGNAAFLAEVQLLLWALLCQGVLNDPSLPAFCASFGTDLVLQDEFTATMEDIASNLCAPLIAQLLASEEFADRVEDGNFSFLHTDRAYALCIREAGERWRWRQHLLDS